MVKSKESAASFEEHRKNVLRSMTVKEKLNAASKLYYSALALKEASLRRANPEWDTKKIQQKAREWMLYART